jgi:hypothetical protein
MAFRDYVVKFRQIHYVPGQVIVAGPKSQVEQARSQMRLQRALNEEGDRLSLGNVGPSLRECEYLRKTGLLEAFLGMAECQEDGEWVVDLFKTQGLRSVRGVVRQINTSRRDGGRCIVAGPNYLLGFPHTLAGSPHTLAGSPHTLAGSPYTAIGDEADPAGFHSQWAFEHIGLTQAGARIIGLQGDQVQVGVFDTCPFEKPGKEVIQRISPPLDLTVVHPSLFDRLPVPPPVHPQGAPSLPDLSDHGLSVSGLVHGVAPHSQIHLYRVLDRHARGNLFVLASAMLDFIYKAPSEGTRSCGRVINLSLGIPPRLPKWDEGILLLELLLAVAYCKGIVVVAAAGNGSSTSASAQPTEFPALLPYALAVAASNNESQRACFSNAGEIAAPGGDGLPRGCAPASGAIGGGREKYGLISLVSKSRYPNGFALCTGTSFSPPLLAGQAALILERMSAIGSPAQGGAIPREVFDRITGSPGIGITVAGLGAGITDLGPSLT